MRADRVYFGTEGGAFYAISTIADGAKQPAVVWTYRDPQRNQPVRAGAAVGEHIVVYGSQSKAIYGLELATGNETWKVTTRARVESSPVIAKDRVVAATTSGKIYLLDLTSGEVKWESDFGGSFVASPSVVDGKILIGNSDGTLYCLGAKQSAPQKSATEAVEKK